MPEAILGLMILALLVERFLSAHAHDVETQRLVNAVLAKTPGELALMNRSIDPPVAYLPRPSDPELEGFEGQAGLGG